MITIDVEKRKVAFSKQEQYLANSATERKKFETEFQKSYSRKTPVISHHTLQVSDSILKVMIKKYSEQSIFQPLKEMQYWFSYTSGANIEPGYTPLYYRRKKGKKISPNKSAIAGIGEGVAGLIAQWFYTARTLARPNHDFPDIVMRSDRLIYLVESKATLSETATDVLNVIKNELIRMVSFTSSCSGMDNRKMIGLLVGTTIINENYYYSYVMEIDIL